MKSAVDKTKLRKQQQKKKYPECKEFKRVPGPLDFFI